MFHIDVMSRRPVYEQLVDEVEHYILRGVLLPNQQMQSVRSLSMELAVNPNTVQKAYSELDRRGIVYAVPGRGCFISSSARERIGERMRQGLGNFTEQVYELALAGIEKETVISCVEDAFSRKGESNDTGRGLDEKI